ncbi:MAG: DUF2807 domain-containing protein [Bacteroidota bacterium]
MNTLKKTFFILSLLSLQLAASAQENTPDMKEYSVPAFRGIDAGSLSNVYITSGTVQSVIMEKDEEDEDRNSTFNVKNGILEIRNSVDGSDNHLNNDRIYICCPNLKYIKASGVSKIKSMTKIKTDSLEIYANGASKIDLDIDVQYLKTDITGASKLTLKGNSIQHIASLNGAAKLSADLIEVTDMKIEGNGAAKANVNVKNKLFGDMKGVSSVNYDKKPDSVNLNNGYWNDNLDANSNQQHSNISVDKDSTKVSIFGKNIEIVEGKDTRISFGNTEMTVDNKGNLKIGKKDKNKPYIHKFSGHWAGFELAFNGYLNKDNGTALPTQYEFLTLNDAKSIGVNLNVFELNANIINNRFGVVSGIGIQWNNYRFGDNVVLVPDSGRVYGFHNTNITTYIKSKLVESWLRVPLFLEYQTAQKKSKQFHIAAGAVFGYKIGSHSKQVHFEGGDRTKPKIYNDFYLNPVKLDAEVRIGWGPINLFASYSLTPMYKDNKGPEIYPYMIGITLTGW